MRRLRSSIAVLLFSLFLPTLSSPPPFFSFFHSLVGPFGLYLSFTPLFLSPLLRSSSPLSLSISPSTLSLPALPRCSHVPRSLLLITLLPSLSETRERKRERDLLCGKHVLCSLHLIGPRSARQAGRSRFRKSAHLKRHYHFFNNKRKHEGESGNIQGEGVFFCLLSALIDSRCWGRDDSFFIVYTPYLLMSFLLVDTMQSDADCWGGGGMD